MMEFMLYVWLVGSSVKVMWGEGRKMGGRRHRGYALWSMAKGLAITSKCSGRGQTTSHLWEGQAY